MSETLGKAGLFARAVSCASISGLIVLSHMAGIGGGQPARVAAQASSGLIVAVDDVRDPVLVPAFEVEYLVEVTNLSQEPVTGLTISAETPAGTYFGEASTNLGSIEAPEQGETGRITVSVKTLSPGAAVEVLFELGLEAPAGSQLLFSALVTSGSGTTVEVAEPTFVINRGEPVLRWEPPLVGPSTERGGPRMLRVERPVEPLVRPIFFPLESFIPGLEYRVYRSDDQSVEIVPENFVAAFLSTQLNTAAIIAPGFYVVTAVYNGVESEPSNSVSFGKGEPVVETVTVKKGVLKARGATFDQAVEVTVDGLSFDEPALVKRDGTRVSQSGRLANGQTLNRHLKQQFGTVLVCFRNANGAVACVRYSHVRTVP
jgi:hypothetical protein